MLDHVKFGVSDFAASKEFFVKALARDNGPPGFRPRYHANYYAAFVIGPDGHNVEAVFHA